MKSYLTWPKLEPTHTSHLGLNQVQRNQVQVSWDLAWWRTSQSWLRPSWVFNPLLLWFNSSQSLVPVWLNQVSVNSVESEHFWDSSQKPVPVLTDRGLGVRWNFKPCYLHFFPHFFTSDLFETRKRFVSVGFSVHWKLDIRLVQADFFSFFFFLNSTSIIGIHN